MKASKEHFLRLLHMELEDMQEDIEALKRHCAAQREQGQISDYVFRENMAAYDNFAADLVHLMRTFDAVEHEEAADIPALIACLRGRCEAHLADRGLGRGLVTTLARKMQKIARYLEGHPT